MTSKIGCVCCLRSLRSRKGDNARAHPKFCSKILLPPLKSPAEGTVQIEVSWYANMNFALAVRTVCTLLLWATDSRLDYNFLYIFAQQQMGCQKSMSLGQNNVFGPWASDILLVTWLN